MVSIRIICSSSSTAVGIFLLLAHATIMPTLADGNVDVPNAMENLNAAIRLQNADTVPHSLNSKHDDPSDVNSLDSLYSDSLFGRLQRIVRRQKRQDEEEEITTEEPYETSNTELCMEGLILPIWNPQTQVPTSDRCVRGLVYFLLMCYLFVGVSIVADRFMGSIEMITSTERNVKVKRKDGSVDIIKVRIWNETVANLTLMALGSSAPEILLSVIEIYGKGFEAGDLGPGTIVGSAAFNLFVIIGICMIIIPTGEVRRIKHLRVFIVTAAFSIFAYIWLYLILAQISPGIIEIWEALVTLLLFPVTVLWAYIAERRLLVYKYLDKNYRVNKRGVIVSAERGSMEMSDAERIAGRAMKGYQPDSGHTERREFDEARREYIEILIELRKKYPESDLESLEMLAQEEMIARGPKSRAFYRIQATRKMIGSGNVLRKIQERAHSDMLEVKAELHPYDSDTSTDTSTHIYFEPGHYTVMENCGEFEVRVVRRGDISGYTTVDFETENGSAEAGTDYIGKQGTLTFPPGVDEQRFKIEIIDDDIFEEDECFYIRLSNPSEGAIVTIPKVATVMILDDDHFGIFGFASSSFETTESIGIFMCKVTRFSGARGKVILPYWTEDGSATGNKDYEPVRGELVFENNDHDLDIEIPIIEESSYEKDVIFYVNIGQPIIAPDNYDTSKRDAYNFLDDLIDDEVAKLIRDAEKKDQNELTLNEKIALGGRPRLGETPRVAVRIMESVEFRKTVDKLVKKANTSTVLGSSSWKEQFRDALTVIPGDETEVDVGDDDQEDKVPSCFDYISHFITLFWKIAFAFIPPTGLWGGYPCFVVAIICIGILTAFIGDAASYFGCTLGVKDSVTAITFVALGTSIPDLFASKIAALQDETADNSVGNVTGSNAVNVFLGIGIAWLVAAVYHAAKGNAFLVQPGSIGFAVSVFCLEACIAITIMMIRRSAKFGGELGGSNSCKWISGLLFLGLWLIYISITTLEAYGWFPYYDGRIFY